ncbi:MAG: hypothetical protein JSV44_05510, partial [Candidatus Zixiibacteriota bacterium]
TLVDSTNRDMVFRSALVFCLKAEPGIIYKRLSSYNNRPLLSGANSLELITLLLRARESAYNACPFHIDTTGLTPAEVAQNIVRLYKLEKMRESGNDDDN